MSCCDGCKHRSPTCHADCAAYLAERILCAHETKDEMERVVADYEIRSIERGGRRKSGKKVYKRPGLHWWKNRRIDTGR